MWCTHGVETPCELGVCTPLWFSSQCKTRDETVCSIMPYKSLKKRCEKTCQRKKDNPEKVKAQKQ